MPLVQHLSKRQPEAVKELGYPRHVLEQLCEFVKITWDGEIELRHAPAVLVREARGHVGRLKFHLDKSACMVGRILACRIRASERASGVRSKRG